MSRPVARRRRIPALFVVAAFVGAACSDGATDASTATSTTIPRPNTVLRVGVEDWPSCVNPLTCDDDALHDQVLQHVLPVAFELDADDDYVASALLASTPTLEPVDTGDVVEIRYEIAPEARWADGRPITSSDFLGTWQAVMATPEAERQGYDHIVTVDDGDPKVAVVTLDTPLVDWQELFGGASGYVLQADAFGATTDLTGQFTDDLPFAAGPYLLSSWSDSGATLSATEPWEGRDAPGVDQVRLDRVQIDGLADPMTFDMLIPATDDDVAAPEGFDVRSTDSTTVLGLWFDQREPDLGPVEHRRAISLLLDRDALTAEAGLDDVVTCAGWVPGVGPWCDAASVEPVDTGPATAAAQLAFLGWVRTPFGLVRGTEPFSVPVAADPTAPGSSAVAAAVSRSLLDIGIAAEVVDVATAQWRASDRSLTSSTGLGVFTLDLGLSPRVDDLYGCPAGVESSVVASCLDDLTMPARALPTQIGDEALATVASLGVRADRDVLWLPLGVVPERSFLRPNRIVVADASNAAGGPLAGLERFESDS